MSWMNRAQGGAAPPPGPDQPPYSAPQSYGAQQNVYPNYQGSNPGNAQQQQYWQMPPQQAPQQPQYNQQYGQVYQQQEYGTNANQYYQQQPPQYNQNYSQANYTQPTQQGYQQSYYQNQGQPNYPQSKTNSDTWEDNWDWGWEDSSKQAQKAQQLASQNTNPAQMHMSQPPPEVNNANVIEESFAANDTWNWPREEKKDASQVPAAVIATSVSSALPQHTPVLSASSDKNAHIGSTPNNVNSQKPIEEVTTLNDRDVVKEHLPNLALGKRLHLENLTPQWSIESQMSQESSDGAHTHSEGTYRSENQSRNSGKSSPGINTDNSNFNYSQAGMEELYPQNVEWSQKSADEPTVVENIPGHNSHQENQDELSSSLQEMSITNRENLAPDTLLRNQESEPKYAQDEVRELGAPQQQSPPAVLPVNYSAHSSPSQEPVPSPSPRIVPSPVPAAVNVAPPPSTSAPLPPPPSSNLPASSSSSLLPPPKNLPPTMPSQNPYKLAGPFSHKNISKSASSNPPTQQYPSQAPIANLTSPSVVNKVSQNSRSTVGFGANLETTPDNSERPDQPQVTSYRPMPASPPIPENLEVAPQNDRNEYLQTAHLSGADYGENTDFSRNIPPPGLRRMVVGQQESEYTQNLNMGGDEPPPGLSRMVPGQQNEEQSGYNQSNDNYMDRHIDGQPMESGGRPYRQAEGQQTCDNYNQPSSVRNSDRRPIGLDRMVPGESSSNDYPQFQAHPFMSSNEQRVVTGEDHEYAGSSEPGLSEVREQVMDGSEYVDQTVRNASRSFIGARESSHDTSPDFSSRAEDQQREIVMEGENLQDLSMISSGDLTYSREQIVDGADLNVTESIGDRKSDAPESLDNTIGGSRRQSLSHVNTSGEDTSERDRLIKSSPRRDKHKSSREREKEGRYSRGEKKYDRESERRPPRDERRSDRDRRERDRDRDRDESPEARRRRDARDRRPASPDERRQRRATRSHRYETEDTDYYSDRDRYQRRQREGSYTSSKPPRHEGSRYRDDREYRRYNTIERESGRGHRDRDRDRERDRYGDRYEQKYRDIDPTRKHGNLRKERDEERKRGEVYSPAEPGATDDERERRRAERRRHRDDYYAGYDPSAAAVDGAGAETADAYALQYQYYEHLRRTDPAAYLQLYRRLLAAPQYRPHALYPIASDAYAGAVEARDERASLHSGRSSAALKGNDTYYGRAGGGGSLLDAPSLRTDLSDRELNTDASLNLQLEESTVRSERMTPFRYSTAHIKGSVSGRALVVVAAAYPVDGRPARVTLAPLHALLAAPRYPSPLVKGVTHKKSIIEFCENRWRDARRGNADAYPGAARDPVGYALIWQLLALLLRQNGVVVGTDIAELLMKNAREYEYEQEPKPATPAPPAHHESRRESSESGAALAPELAGAGADSEVQPEGASVATGVAEDDADAVTRFRDLLICGNRQDALEWALDRSLWGHALVLAGTLGARARGAAAARFAAALRPNDPLRSLYAAHAARPPPAAQGVAEARWGDWRPHAAMLLANPTPRADHDTRTLLQLGDSLLSRGLLYCAQFCYVSAGVPFAAHPLAPMQGPQPAPAPPPRLTLLLADNKAHTLQHFATDEAIFATEVYEYALSLNQDYVIKEFQVYKVVAATRLMDCGQFERALAYTEQAARAVTRAPADYPPGLVRALAALADRLKYDDPSLQEEAGSEGDSEPSPRHRQWLQDVASAASALQASPQHAQAEYYAQHAPATAWGDQAQQYEQSVPSYADLPAPQEAPDYSHYYQSQQPGQGLGQQSQEYGQQGQDYSQQSQDYSQQSADYSQPSHEYSQQSHEYSQPSQEYGQQPPEYGQEAPPDGYAPDERPYDYWQGRNDYGYGEAGAGAGESRPMITMPGAGAGAARALYDDDDRPPSADTDRETDTPNPKSDKKSEGKDKGEGKRGGGGGGGGGWLGGILTRLSLRAPNQMILPDDKNPTIVWDAEHKRWRNLDGDEDTTRAPPPPPSAAHLAMMGVAPQPGAPAAGVPPPTSGPADAPPAPAPAAPPTSNIFKMQKSRHIKKSYVDVFNPSGAATRALPPPGDVLGPPAPAAPPARLFVPAPRAPHQGVYDAQPGEEAYRSGI